MILSGLRILWDIYPCFLASLKTASGVVSRAEQSRNNVETEGLFTALSMKATDWTETPAF